ncbi:hypothetical protein BO94DRAFT_531963, partial [Aspergillus sclerotioniger CBS 115572]
MGLDVPDMLLSLFTISAAGALNQQTPTKGVNTMTRGFQDSLTSLSYSCSYPLCTPLASLGSARIPRRGNSIPGCC